MVSVGLAAILMVFAFVLFVAAAFNFNHPKVSTGWLGAAFAAASMLAGYFIR